MTPAPYSPRDLEWHDHAVAAAAAAWIHEPRDTEVYRRLVEAALRPTMRFVALKTEDQQARAMLFRTRQMFVGQRTQMINALRGHLAEHGLVAARGPAHLKRLADAIEDGDTTLPAEVRDLGQM